MTATIETVTPDITSDVEPIEFAHLDPRSLTIEANVRIDPDLDKDFVASIKERGVLVPVIVVRQVDGTLHVRAGQRRTLGAIEAGRETIPARIIDATDEADRIVDQIIENDKRRDLRDADRTAAFQQLSLMGLPAAQIAKRLHIRKDTVDKGLTVARSTLAAAVIDRHNLTLDQALVLTEFDDDPDAVKSLTVIAVKEPGQFDHAAQRLRDQRAEDAARQVLTDELTAAGVQVIDKPAWDEKVVTSISNLTGADGQVLTAETHTACPGRAAYLGHRWEGGSPVIAAWHLCLDPRANDHTRRSTSGTTGTGGGPMSEEQKAERREIIAGNQAWRSAETVRRAWLAKFAARRTAPKDAPALLAYALTECTNTLAYSANLGHPLARDLLAITTTVDTRYGHYAASAAITAAIDTASPARAQVIALVVALAAIEARTDTATWRHGSPDVARYLRALASWGYTLSEIEQGIIDQRAADQARVAAPHEENLNDQEAEVDEQDEDLNEQDDVQ